MRTLSRCIALLTACWLVSVAALPAVAGTQTGDVVVRVSDYSFSPATVTVVSGGRVTWDWGGQARHSATADDGTFDTHPTCSDEVGFRSFCADPSDPSTTWTAPTVTSRTEIPYRCKLHVSQGMRGTVVVVPDAPSSPSPSPASSPSPSPSPAADTSSSPPPTASQSPATSPSPTRRYGPPQAFPAAPMPTVTSSALPEPEVAGPAEPDLEEFPSPSPLPTGGDPERDAADEVAIPQPGSDGPSRGVLIAVAAVAVVGTSGAFGAFVLFGPDWR